MSEHTPTPWNISHVRTTEDTAMIVGGEGFEPIADVTEDGDAAFIVQAVNNHDALVKALEDLQSADTAYRMTYELDGYHHQSTLEARSKLRMAGYRAREALVAVFGTGDPK